MNIKVYRPFGFSFLATAFFLGLLTLLSGCGSGGGETAKAATPSTLVVSPSTSTGAIGQMLNFVVTGGTTNYTVTSSNPSIATVSAVSSSSGQYSFTATLLSAGEVTFTVVDAKSVTAATVVTVTASGGAALYTTAPSAITIATGGAPTYTIAGGTAPYTASSSNAAIATVDVSSPTMIISAVAAGTANVVIHDAVGASVTIVVTVANSAGVALYTTAPLAITIAAIGGAQTYTIGGGTAPYTATSDKTDVASASVSGTALTITGKADGNANILVRDATGAASVTIAVNVATGQGFTVIGSATTWTISGNGDTILTNDCDSARRSPYSVYFVNGGTPPYSVSSTAPLIGTIIGTDSTGSAPLVPSTPAGAYSVNLTTVTVTQAGGYFVVAWPNADNLCANGGASLKVIDSTGLVPVVTPTFTVNFEPS